MGLSFTKRIAAAAFALAAVCAAVPGSGATSAPAVFKPSFITCQPGFVYRCTPKGCFCVKA